MSVVLVASSLLSIVASNLLLLVFLLKQLHKNGISIKSMLKLASSKKAKGSLFLFVCHGDVCYPWIVDPEKEIGRPRHPRDQYSTN